MRIAANFGQTGSISASIGTDRLIGGYGRWRDGALASIGRKQPHRAGEAKTLHKHGG